ncbi:hypothetical protein BO94DRAFT_529639 [Aspergillus sclerotioniger CBS 115572]|uniref:NB-ARC domain-containing protein n=1 Tax=Aspergillus sclerotioniger CBS 115572 TaxID=1450535 RepID=A0A317XG93_9EURO|nr:hypothetical protein BO94DRAFT_529639 [Aspergillus sclerotioniger CBS 115572]PWY96248.1 hypothetical protein BO94DRAFT_529639 [Aspergillus sclerotioniger CBS 115572]
MTVVTHPRDRHDFHIAIICALPREADAVIALLDHRWDNTEELYTQVRHLGKDSAAGFAIDLRATFPGIQLALVVGVCGGVPSNPHREIEIFLGDVIISESVVGYNFDGQHQIGFLKHAEEGAAGEDIPPSPLQSVLRKLETDNYHSRLQEETRTRLRTLQSQPHGKFHYPGFGSDRLFQPSYLHRHRDTSTCTGCATDNVCMDAIEASCSDLGCDEDNLLHRERTVTSEGLDPIIAGFSPAVHLGQIGSVSTVMKSGSHRDELAHRERFIGLERGGVDLCSFFPSLVIKGVCDYADSHKSKPWQDYAAATAAACTKAFLQSWASDAMETVVDTVGNSPQNDTVEFMVDIHSDDQLVGRDEVMKALADELKTQDRVALVASGGMGKSRVALEYARQFQGTSISVFWIHASTKAMFLQSYEKIARKVSIVGYKASDRDSAYMVTEWFESDSSGRWLIVLDNADDHEVLYGSDRLVDLLPRSKNGSILLTTRDKRVGLDFTGSSSRLLLLDRLNTSHAQDLLVSRLESKPSLEAVRDLVEELAGVPLAIIQAAAYMKHNGIDTGEYLQLYCESPQSQLDVLNEDYDDVLNEQRSNRNPIAATWFISFEYINRNFPVAGDMLKRMSLLESHAIPIFLVVASGKLPPELVKALEILEAFSLITSNARGDTISREQGTYDMHRLVRLATRSWLAQNHELRQWTASTLKILSQNFPSVDSLKWRVVDNYMAYMPHAFALLQSDEIQFIGEDIPSAFVPQQQLKGHAPDGIICGECAAALMLKLAKTCSAFQNHQGAMDWAMQAFKVRQWIFGLEQEGTVQAMTEAVIALYSNKDITKAKELGDLAIKQLDEIEPSPALEAYNYDILGFIGFEDDMNTVLHEHFLQALQIRLQMFPPDHPAVLVTKSNLITAYIREELYPEAEALLKEILPVYNEVYGPMSFPVLQKKSTLSWLYQLSGRVDDALLLNAELSAAHPRRGGDQGHDTIMAMIHSGGVLQDMGRPAAAVDVFQKAMGLIADLQATGTPIELEAITGLSQALTTLGNYADAEPLLVRLVKSCIRVAGDQQITVTAMRRLADLYESWEMCLAAQALREKVAQIEQRHSGRGTVAACLSQCELGLNLIKQGRHAEGKPHLYTALQYPLTADDSGKRENVDRMNSIANGLTDCGFDRGEYFLEAEHVALDAVRLIQPRIRKLPNVAQSSLQSLGFVYQQLGKAAESEEQYQEAINVISGRSHIEWLSPAVMIQCSSVLLQQGKYSAAMSMAAEAVEKLGAHPEPIKVTLARGRANLATAYMEIGNCRSAGSLLVAILSDEYEKAWDPDQSTVSSLLHTFGLIQSVAEVLNGMGRWERSQLIHENMQAIFVQLLGTAHMRTLQTALLLRDTLNYQGKFMDALVLSLECKDRYWQRFRQDTTPEKMMIAQLDSGLAWSYQGLGDHSTAEALSRQALKTNTDITGADSPESLQASTILATILVSQGGPKLMKGSAIQRRAVETWITLAGKNSLRTVRAMEAVAKTCKIQGDEEQYQVWTEKASSAKQSFEPILEEDEKRIDELVRKLFEKWGEDGERVMESMDRRRRKVWTMSLP